MLKIGLICGCFDLFHIGHLNILEKCKQECDYLIVGVCNDTYIKFHKNRNAIINETDRLRIIKALKVVDAAFIVDETIIKDRLAFCKEHNVSIVFDGSDWKGNVKYENLKKNGIEVIFFPYTQGISTSELIKKTNIIS